MPRNLNYFVKQFKGLLPAAQAIIALRAAMRVLPVLAFRQGTRADPFSYWKEKERTKHVLAIFRSYQASAFLCGKPEDAVAPSANKAVSIAAYAVASAANDAADAAPHSPYSAAANDRGLIAGQPYRDTLQRRIETVKAVVVLWTENAISSKFVRAEADLADSQHKLICLRDPKLDVKRIPMPFASNNHIIASDDMPGIMKALALKGVKPRI